MSTVEPCGCLDRSCRPQPEELQMKTRFLISTAVGLVFATAALAPSPSSTTAAPPAPPPPTHTTPDATHFGAHDPEVIRYDDNPDAFRFHAFRFHDHLP